jgi:hypothetical protein
MSEALAQIDTLAELTPKTEGVAEILDCSSYGGQCVVREAVQHEVR